ncbi:MAG TPA: hypothetical protein VFW55_05315 [Propionicimonas sp.]|nr:hypothetical protein [Propionicimonas sp.]
MTQNAHHHKPLMVQAPVRALDADGMAVVSTGTVAFAIAAAVCWFTRADLEAIGKLWYLGVSLTGTALGLLGLAFGIYRKLRRRRQRAVPADASIEEALIDTDGVPDRE